MLVYHAQLLKRWTQIKYLISESSPFWNIKKNFNHQWQHKTTIIYNAITHVLYMFYNFLWSGVAINIHEHKLNPTKNVSFFMKCFTACWVRLCPSDIYSVPHYSGTSLSGVMIIQLSVRTTTFYLMHLVQNGISTRFCRQHNVFLAPVIEVSWTTPGAC